MNGASEEQSDSRFRTGPQVRCKGIKVNLPRIGLHGNRRPSRGWIHILSNPGSRAGTGQLNGFQVFSAHRFHGGANYGIAVLALSRDRNEGNRNQQRAYGKIFFQHIDWLPVYPFRTTGAMETPAQSRFHR